MSSLRPVLLDLLFLAFLSLGVVGALWTKTLGVHFVPQWDEAHHLTIAYDYYKPFLTRDWLGFWHIFLTSNTIYPPLYHWLVAVGYLVFGVGEKVGALVNVPSVFLLTFGTYLLARTTTTRGGALVAGGLTLFVPLFLNLWTDAMTDTTSLALFILLFWAIVKTKGFTSTAWSAAAGIIGLLLLLTRYAFISSAAPLVWYAIISLKTNARRATKNVLLMLLLMLPSLAWYVPHWKTVYDTLTFYANPNNFPITQYGLPTVAAAENWLYFLLSSVGSVGIGLIPLCIFFLVIISGLRRLSQFEKLFLGSIVSNYVLQTVWLDKIPKYFSYSYPLILILICGWAMQQHTKRGALLLLLVGSMLFNVIVAVRVFPLTTPLGPITKTVYLLPGVKFEYTREPWPTKAIIRDNFPVGGGVVPKLLVLTDYRYLNHVTFLYYASVAGIPLDVFPAITLYNPARPDRLQEESLRSFDYIFTKSGPDFGVFVDEPTTQKINERLTTSTTFILLRSYDLPDATTALIYRRIDEGAL